MSIQNPSKHAAQILFVLIFSLLSQFSFSQEIDPYENNIRRFSEMNYIFSSKWVANEEEAWEKYIQAVNKAGFDFALDNSGKLRYTHGMVSLEEGLDLHSYTSSSGKEWVYLIKSNDSEALQKQYGNYKKLWASYKEKGIRGVGENASRSASRRFGQFITFHTGEAFSSLNVYILSEKSMLVMGMDLGFPIKVKYDELSHEQRIAVRDEYKRFQILLDKFSDHFVHKDEWLKKPLRGERLTAAQRLYGFTQFWTEVKYNFAFFDQVPDLDWDMVLYKYLPIIEKDQSNEAYFNTLKLICAKLGDGHTNIYPPSSLNRNLDWPGISLKNFKQKPFVVNVKEEFSKQIPLGSEILAIDGVPSEEFLQNTIFPYISSSTQYILYDWGIRDMLDGEYGSEVSLKIKNPKGKIEKVKLVRDRKLGGENWVRERSRRNGLLNFEHLPEDIAYVSLNSFSNEKIIEEFEKRVDSIKACKGVIIDLRRNGGGSSSIGYAILNHFTDKPYKGSAQKTRKHIAAHKAWGQFVDKEKSLEELSEFDQTSRLVAEGNYWHEFEVGEITPDVKSIIQLPLLVLIGHNTASAAEDFLVALDQTGIAKVIGAPSFGSTGQPLMMDLPGGARARICTKRDTYPDGREFVGYGIQPDFKVAATIEEYLADKDVVLDYAIQYMKKHPGYSSNKK